MKQDLLEKSLLGTMLEGNYLIEDAQLTPDMFQLQLHRTIFHYMCTLIAEGKPVDYITLMTKSEPSEIGGAQYVVNLTTFANVEKFDGYASMLRQAWRDKMKHQILFSAQQEEWSIEKIMETLDDVQLGVDVHDTSIFNKIAQMAERPYEDLPATGAVPTPLKNLSKLIEGFKPGEFTIIAARPSMGKTDVMNNFALYAGWKGYLPIIFSLEMSEKILIDRLIATTGRYSRLKMRDPKTYFSEEQRQKWIPTITLLSKADIHIDDRASLTLPQIRSQARRIMKQQPDKRPVIFIDYLQIIQTEEDSGLHAMAIAKMSRGLKQLAKEFDCPVVCLAQLNRSVETRAVKRPLMSDLRDSGNIEQDADIIILLYREGYYEKLDAEKSKILELIVAKNRNGPTGIVYAYYNKMTGLLASDQGTEEVASE